MGAQPHVGGGPGEGAGRTGPPAGQGERPGEEAAPPTA